MRQKLRGISGETLTETLVGILIVALSSLLFVTMLSVSVRMLNTAARTDKALYQALSAAETNTVYSFEKKDITLTFTYSGGSDTATVTAAEAKSGNVALTYYTYKEASGS